MLKLTVGEHLVNDQIQVLVQAQRFKRCGVCPEKRPQPFRQTAPPNASRFAADLATSCGRQPARPRETALAATSEAAPTTKERGCTTNVHRNHFGPLETKRHAYSAIVMLLQDVLWPYLGTGKTWGMGTTVLVNPKLLLDRNSCVARHPVQFERHGMLYHENLKTGPTPAGSTG
jgi:hypothetical protein